MKEEIIAYNNAQEPHSRQICELLADKIQQSLSKAESKIWHGAPVWFIAGNPIVGYWVRKENVQLLFWSGQSFDESGLKPEGSFKAAEARYKNIEETNTEELARWLEKSKAIQWDYKNIVKRRGVLERLV